MKKNDSRIIIAVVIFFLAFTTISVVLPCEKNLIFWLSYLFAVVAITTQPLFWRKTINGENARSRFYGFPIVKIGIVYLIAQLPTSVSFMMFSFKAPVWGIVIPSMIIMGTVFIGLIAADAVKEEIERQDAVLVRNTDCMSRLRRKMAVVLKQSMGNDFYNEIKLVEENLRYSDPVTSDATAELENSLEMMISALEQLVMTKEKDTIEQQCREILNKLEERNQICKENKARQY